MYLRESNLDLDLKTTWPEKSVVHHISPEELNVVFTLQLKLCDGKKNLSQVYITTKLVIPPPPHPTVHILQIN
jgi:hypothetical protein